jgi:hypothetical protein
LCSARSLRSNHVPHLRCGQLYLDCYVVLPGHLSQHAKAATAEGLIFSDPIHKKSARNLNLYDFCHSPKKMAAVKKRGLLHPKLLHQNFKKSHQGTPASVSNPVFTVTG